MMFDPSSGKRDFDLRESESLVGSSESLASSSSSTSSPAHLIDEGLMKTKEDTSLSATWRTHENASRVKLWMDSHERFAMGAEYLVGLVAPEKPFGKPELENFIKAFDEHVWAVEKHSNFEEKKIFPYFQERPALQIKLGPKELHHEHTHWRESVEKIRKILQCEDPTQEQKRLHEALVEYEDELKKHMRAEEDDILRPWLEMSTWDYALFFGAVFVKMLTSPFE